jgi:hypothetical protein
MDMAACQAIIVALNLMLIAGLAALAAVLIAKGHLKVYPHSVCFPRTGSCNLESAVLGEV